MNNEVIFSAKEYLNSLGMRVKWLIQTLNAADNFWTTGKFRVSKLRGGGGYRHMKIKEGLIYEKIISTENLFAAWQEFLAGKRGKPDVQVFASALIDNILQLNADLANKTYEHGGYFRFNISDPKPRNISKAQVRDRLLHHAIYRILYPFFDKTFITDSYSCRNNKGTHKSIQRLSKMFYMISQNNTRTVWVLKLDIKKFFASIDHGILTKILNEYIPDQDIIWLLEEIVNSFSATISSEARDPSRKGFLTPFGMELKGLPLGNLTSQLFVNIYMNELDQFMKHKLKAKYYIRYADDFVILSANKQELIEQLDGIDKFLQVKLKLKLHPNKIILKTFASGIDFLGWVNFPHHRVLRTSTRKRIKHNPKNETLQSYLGLLQHGNTHIIQNMLNLIYETDNLH